MMVRFEIVFLVLTISASESKSIGSKLSTKLRNASIIGGISGANCAIGQWRSCFDIICIWPGLGTCAHAFCEECLECPADHWCPGDNNKYDCFSGRCSYENEPEGSCAPKVPAICPAGEYRVGCGVDSDMRSSPGKCLSCVPGTYSTAVGATSPSSCLNCPAGTWQTGFASSQCWSCPAGTFSTVEAAYSPYTCLHCSAGTYSPVVGASSPSTCKFCVAGTYTAGDASSSCLSCASGRFSTAEAADSEDTCAACAAGTYSKVVGATSNRTCASCPPGKYSSAIASFDCESCGWGTFSTAPSAISATTCQPCSFGTYSWETGGNTPMICSWQVFMASFMTIGWMFVVLVFFLRFQLCRILNLRTQTAATTEPLLRGEHLDACGVELAGRVEPEGRPGRCVVCMEKSADYSFIPCGHRCVCEEDAARMLRSQKSCPICRELVRDILRIYDP